MNRKVWLGRSGLFIRTLQRQRIVAESFESSTRVFDNHHFDSKWRHISQMKFSGLALQDYGVGIGEGISSEIQKSDMLVIQNQNEEMYELKPSREELDSSISVHTRECFIDTTLAIEFFDEVAPRLTFSEFKLLDKFLRQKSRFLWNDSLLFVSLDQLWREQFGNETSPPWYLRSLGQVMSGQFKDFTPKINRSEWSTYIEQLIEYRDSSLQRSFNWSSNERDLGVNSYLESINMNPGDKKYRKFRKEAYQNYNSKKLELRKMRSMQDRGKSADVILEEVEGLLQHLAYNLPPETFANLMDILKPPSKRHPSCLFSSIRNVSALQLHLVVSRIADFLYIDIEPGSQIDEKLTKARVRWDRLRQRVATQIIGFEEMMKLGKRPRRKASPSGTVDISVNGGVRKSPPPKTLHTHVHLEALTGSQILDFSSLDLETMVFVDNLPIDINEETLHELYSRFDDIRSIKIFNQRPDLDPGPLKPKDLAERTRRSRLILHHARSSKWKTPRTPLYASITFASSKGYQMATNTSLRIFGTVYKGHPMRTWIPRDLNTLYIEGFAPTLTIGDLTTALNYELEERDVFIYLKQSENERKIPSSCEIKFSDFETSYVCYDAVVKAFERMSEKHTDQEVGNEHLVSVNWFKTPLDAMLYWTREKGFETLETKKTRKKVKTEDHGDVAEDVND